MIFSFNNNSLSRHNVSQQEILEALEDPYKIEVETGEYESNPTSLWIGKTFTERLLEVGVEYLEDSNHIYHAAKARAKFAVKYARER